MVFIPAECFLLGSQTILLNFLQSDFLFISCLRGAGFSLSLLYQEENMYPYIQKGRWGRMQIVCKLYGDYWFWMILIYKCTQSCEKQIGQYTHFINLMVIVTVYEHFHTNIRKLGPVVFCVQNSPLNLTSLRNFQLNLLGKFYQLFHTFASLLKISNKYNFSDEILHV